MIKRIFALMLSAFMIMTITACKKVDNKVEPEIGTQTEKNDGIKTIQLICREGYKEVPKAYGVELTPDVPFYYDVTSDGATDGEKYALLKCSDGTICRVEGGFDVEDYYNRVNGIILEELFDGTLFAG